MLNNTTLAGRITREPEIKTLNNGSGDSVMSFTLACDRDYKNKQTGEKETDFIDCVAWRQTAEVIAKYVSKGDMLQVVGRIQVRNYEDKEGNKRRATEIQVNQVYLPPKNSTQSENPPTQAPPQQGGYPPPQNTGYVPPAPQQGYPPQGQQYAQQYTAPSPQSPPPSMPPPQSYGYNTSPQGQLTDNEEELPF